MTIKLFNTLTRKKELLKPITEGLVKMYTCGPTVYDFPHIGNYRAYIVSDLLKRYLRFRGIKVKHVMNITDVDDKTIRGAQKLKISLTEFTQKYEKAFFEDLEALNILPADTFPRATEHVEEMVEITNKLLKKGMAYKADDGSTYYNVTKFPDYGKLAHLDLAKLKEGASGRVKADEYTKENVQDFALWKAYMPDDGDVSWKNVLGKGRPGWHIECSAMAMKYLGETFDIHCGGIDLIFPHHQNEIAQSEGATGKRFVHYWVHNEWLLVDGQKMSKSMGNFFTLRDVLGKGYNSKAVRYLLLSTHYRQQLNFTFGGVDAAKNSVERLQELVRNLKTAKKSAKGDEQVSLLIEKTKLKFEKAMDDDLNISEALAALFDFVRDANKLMETGISQTNAEEITEFLEDVNEVIAVIDFAGEEKLTAEQERLVEERESMRKQKKFKEADVIRQKLKEQGIILDDTAAGVKVKKLK